MADNLEIQDNEEDCPQIIHFESIGSPDATDAESPNECDDSKDDSFELSRKSERKSFENLELDFESDINIKEADVENVDQSHCEDKNEENGDKEKKTVEQVNKELEEGEDDEGEISSDDDEELEEGEVKDKDAAEFPNKLGGRQICRFFNRGKCTFGKVCRFLHLNNNSQGNYSMFPNTGNAYFPPVNDQVYMMNPRTRNQDYFIPPPIPSEEPTPLETAWERGLRAAKELVKKAHIRRGASPDFDEKRLNLTPSLDTTETDKENSEKKRERHSQQTYYKSEDELPPYNYSEPTWKRNYDNFEVRYNSREDAPSYRDKDRSRPYRRETSPTDRERDKYGGAKNIHRNENDPRAVGAVSRKRAEEWFDPYRRSKSPKGRRSRSRTRSYSSVSSYSHSENRSSASRYSRSSSRSSGDSSRSPSPFVPKRRSPNQAISSPKGENRYLAKKRTGGRIARSRSYTRSRSSRSRSMSRSSSSRSISMDSITSPESGSSSGSLVRHKQNIPIPSNKDEEKEKSDEKRRRQLYFQLQSLRGNKDENESKNIDTFKVDDGDYIDDTLADMQEVSGPSFPSLEYLLPSSEKKEPVKAKQPIKLTLLNKPPQSKFSSMPKKFDLKYKETGEPSSFGTSQSTLKRPLSPPSQAVSNKPAVALKKSASSRRDELLKQLKAVEDAIARKRSKMV